MFRKLISAFVSGAAFMLGKYHSAATNDSDERRAAVQYFQQVRVLAKNGFADSSGLAVASLGAEARIWLRHHEFERALELYLDQYAAGDGSALNSLRFAAAATLGETGAGPDQLAALAKNSRVRRLLTAYLISRHPYLDRSRSLDGPDAQTAHSRGGQTDD